MKGMKYLPHIQRYAFLRKQLHLQTCFSKERAKRRSGSFPRAIVSLETSFFCNVFACQHYQHLVQSGVGSRSFPQNIGTISVQLKKKRNAPFKRKLVEKKDDVLAPRSPSMISSTLTRSLLMLCKATFEQRF